MTARRTLVVKGRQGIRVTVQIEVYRGDVWITAVDPALSVEAILEPAQGEHFIEQLAQAVREARGGTQE